jgi:hypothetical protein
MKETVRIVHSDRSVDAIFDHSIAKKLFCIANGVYRKREEILNIVSRIPIEQQHKSKIQSLDVDEQTKNRNITCIYLKY